MPGFNFDDTDAVERQLLPVGWYEVEVASVDVKESSTGKPMLTVQFLVTDGEYEGQSIFQNMMLKGKAGGITKSFLRAATGDPAGGSRNTDELVGCHLRVRITQKIWKEEDNGDGELQNNIVKYAVSETDAFG